MRSPRSRTLLTLTAVAGLALTAACAGTAKQGAQSESEREREAAARAHAGPMPNQAMEKLMMIAGNDPNEAAEESHEAATIAQQYAESRTAPGVVSPGAYTAAYKQMLALGSAGGSWNEVTKKPYNSDDPRYRDYYSNSSGGAGFVTGRVTGVAAAADGTVYAASADGGVWRRPPGAGWSPMADQLPSLASGFLTLAGNSLFYAQGEATTAFDTMPGSGVYRVANPRTENFTQSSRVGGKELESATIGRLRFGGGKVWAATSRGIWWHSATTNAGAWHFSYAPNMAYMPEIKDDAGNVLVPAGSQCPNNTACGATNAPYKNIVNDIAVDPTNANHVIAALGWRSGDTYNGFYETKNGGDSWTKINPGGAIPANDIGYVTFAWAADSSKLYAINQSPKLLNNGTRNANTVLEGIYVSKNGSITGPWSKIADSTKLANSGSALKQSIFQKGYGPGVQAWYNQFLAVDPNNPDHVYAGLEEVFETKNAGSTWTTPGPYWNFYFPCWDISDAKNTCPKTTHPDQHAATIGGPPGALRFYAGNDGGVYSRPVNGSANSDGHATDWQSLNDGTVDALQYYSVAWGADKTTGGSTQVVSGGMQDNGTSNLFGVTATGTSPEPVMGSGFGGDGGDSMANPADGCQQAQEYTGLSMYVTKNCNVNPGPGTLATSTAKAVAPPDPNPRFIAPFDQDRAYNGTWIAGGQDVWTQDKGYDISAPSDWTKAFDLGAGHQATAVAMLNKVGYVGWCGPCNNSGFTRGLATNSSGEWKQVTLPGSFPNRYIGGIGIDPANNKHVYLAVSGFNRNFTEGPGAGVGHIFESTNGGGSWTNITTNYPDIPTSSIKQLANGALVAGSDLGVFYRAPGVTTWKKLGTNLPLVAVTDVEPAAGNIVYAATHGRGIWSIPMP